LHRVRLQNFEGPLDLLLFFIRRDELDINDIPIARITDEYLEYVRLIEEVDLDGAAEFIYMAALLISIKAAMLLPRPQLDDEGEPVDPREELVQRLMEYMRYKEAAQHLEQQFEARGDVFTRGGAGAERSRLAEDADVTYRVSVFDLISVLQRVLKEAPPEILHPVARYDYTLEEQQAYVLARLRDHGGTASFVEMVRRRPRPFVIVTFLAVLDLVQRQAVRVVDGATREDFYLEAGAGEAAVHERTSHLRRVK
jgi:segregation and condensation protein A